MNVLTALPWRTSPPVRPLRPACEPPPAERDGDPGCGWFESSRDLASGLLVCEQALHLADWPAALPA